jgi:hypothetical protein
LLSLRDKQVGPQQLQLVFQPKRFFRRSCAVN